MKRRLTDTEIDAQLTKLAAMSDEDIDTDDIPEAPAENWALARRPGLYRPVKKHVTMRLDADVIEWFKTKTGGRGYQSEINRVLRKYVSGV
jgi:uncharacterized protein (DUF4415 family)